MVNDDAVNQSSKKVVGVVSEYVYTMAILLRKL